MLDSDLPAVTIHLTVKDQDGNAVDSLAKDLTIDADDNWQYSFTGVPTMDENGNPYIYDITEEVPEVPGVTITQVSAVSNSGGGTDFTNRWQGNVTLNIEKVWEDGGLEDLRPDTLTLQVVGSTEAGAVYTDTVELSRAEDWKAVLTLPHWYYAEGTDGIITAYEITYTVEEKETVPGYQQATCVREPATGYTDKATAKVTLTNTLQATMNVIVKKTWLGSTGNMSSYPSVTAYLNGQCGDDTATRSLSLRYANNWTETVNDVPLYKVVNGVLTRWNWTVTEDDLSGWTLSEVQESEEISEDGFILRTYNLINTPDDTSVNFAGYKYWQTPGSDSVTTASLPKVTITLHVMKNGTEVKSLTCVVSQGYYSFRGVPTRDEDGTLYTYAFTEEVEEVDGLTFTQVKTVTNQTGAVNFTNRWNENVPLTLTKEWNDERNNAQWRPDTVTIRVIGKVDDAVVVEKEVALTGTGDTWTTQVDGLLKWYYDDDGAAHEIQYSVEEDTVPGYNEPTITPVMTDDVLTGYTVQNEALSYMHVLIQKQWIGAEYDGVLEVELKNAYQIIHIK